MTKYTKKGNGYPGNRGKEEEYGLETNRVVGYQTNQMKLETVGRSMWRSFTEAKREMHDNHGVEEKTRKNEGTLKELKNNKAQGIDNYTYAQKLRGRSYSGTDKDMPRLHNGSMAVGLLAIHPNTN